MRNLYPISVALFGLIIIGSLVESHDPINNTARLLRELRRLRKHNAHYSQYGGSGGGLLGGLSPIREDDGFNNNNNNRQSSQQSNNNNNNNGQNNKGVLDNVGNVDQQIQQAISQLSQLPTRPPYQLSMVNRGVSTILGGVNQGNLADILRGSFQFTRNENVRSVADTVIDSIFGQRGKK